MFGLDTDTIRNIKDCFAKIPQIQKVLLYGSRAKGNYKNGSDIDLSLIGKNLNPDDNIYPLKKELNKLHLPYTFDISILSKLDKLEFISHVLNAGKTFYQKETNELPAGWEMKKLGDVCEVINGATPLKSKKEYWYNGNINWFTVNDIRKQGRVIKYTTQKISQEGFKSASLKLLPPKSVLLCCTASIGEFAITDIELTTNQQFNGLVVKNFNHLLPEYLFYFSSTLKERLLSVSGKTTIDFISMTKVKNIIIPTPPLVEQKRIVAVLDKTFTAIDKIKNNTEKNLANTKELWQSYLQQSFNNPKKNWQQKKLGDVTTIQLGKTPQRQTAKFWDKMKKTSNVWLKISDLIHGHTIIDSKEYVSDEGAKMVSITPKGTLMLSYKLTLGRVSFAGKDLLTNEAIASFLNLDSNTSKIFLYYYFSFFNWDLAIAGDIKLKGKTLNKAKLNALQIPIPPLAEQKQITERLDYLSQKTTALQETYCKKIQNLIELKKSILQQAFIGEL